MRIQASDPARTRMVYHDNPLRRRQRRFRDRLLNASAPSKLIIIRRWTTYLRPAAARIPSSLCPMGKSRGGLESRPLALANSPSTELWLLGYLHELGLEVPGFDHTEHVLSLP